MKQKMSGKKFTAIMSAIIAVLLVVAIAASVAMPLLSSTMDTYLGRGERYTVQIEGAQNWDTKYYDQKFTDTNSATGSVSYGLAVSKRITDEGEILLKNNGVLPIAKGTSVTPFGYRFLSPIYGGTGSGNVDASKDYIVTAEKGLANFAVNSQVVDKMKSATVIELTADGAKPVSTNSEEGGTGFTGATTAIYEFDPSIYSGTEAGCADTVAIVYIGRVGGEGGCLQDTPYADGTPHELALSTYEKEMLTFARKNCRSVVAVIESSNVMELGELMEGGAYECDSIVWVGGAGATGFASLGDILCGDVNPSGRTVDLWDRDLTKNPVYVNFLPERTYANSDGIMVEFMNYTNGLYFVELEEGIYSGYRYFETAHDLGAINYEQAVVYPFGYGLSYTTFIQEITDFNTSSDDVSVTVRVTNTGSAAGKDVVQLYYTAPYTDYDRQNKVEKSTVNLAAFDKTGVIEPGKSEELILTFPKEDMASYAYMHDNSDGTKGCYLLEAGTYTISLRNNSHDVIEAKTFDISATVIYDSSNPRQSEKDAQSAWSDEGESLGYPKAAKSDPAAGYVAATNIYQDSSDYMNSEAILLTRADWQGTQPTAPEDGKVLSEERLQRATNFDIENDALLGNKTLASQYTAPTSGQANGLSVSAMRGVDYNDPSWDLLLDQLIYNEELYNAFNWATFEIKAVESIGLPNVVCHDGPQGWGMTGADGGPDTTAFATEVVVAATFNVDLAYEYGDAIGQESLVIGFTGWYGPAMNLHRSAFNGRNFEYYSEDPFLNGKMGAACISGAADNGVICFLKHFFGNDYEGPACAMATWADEQTLREIYAKPFEIAAKEATMHVKYISDTEGTTATKVVRGLTGMMMGANMINGEWNAANTSVLSMLRNEWGFEGLTSTDMCLECTPNIIDKVLRSGTDLRMGTFWMQYVPGWVGQTNLNDPDSDVTKANLRRAFKNVAYAVANSNMMQGTAPGSITRYKTSPWVYALIAGDVVVGISIAAIVTVIIRRRKDEKANPDKYKK